MTDPEPSLVEKIIEIHSGMEHQGVVHAFGGALALAYYTREPRATADIDLNVSLGAGDALLAFSALPSAVDWDSDDLEHVARDDQVRVWWGRTPIDLFFRASSFHDGVAERTAWMPFADTELPFLSANDLAVFKSLFDRPKDWLDIGAMVESGNLDIGSVAAVLESLIGEDQRVAHLRSLGSR